MIILNLTFGLILIQLCTFCVGEDPLSKLEGTNPKIISVQKAKVQALTESKYKDEKGVKVTYSLATAEDPLKKAIITSPQPPTFSKLISKEASRENSPVKVSVSLFEETGKKGEEQNGDFEALKMIEEKRVEEVKPINLLHPTFPLGLNYQYYHTGPQAKQIQFVPKYAEPLQKVQYEYQNEVQPLPLPLPQYNFGYRVHDNSGTGANHGHVQVRNGGFTYGRYMLMDSDGLLRTVSYSSDPVYGFNAMVDRQPVTYPGYYSYL